jgi:hypothetical protein
MIRLIFHKTWMLLRVMNKDLPRNIGILLAVIYGVSLRVLFELNTLKEYAEIVSITFMFLVPFVIGYIRIHFELKVNYDISYTRMIILAWQPIFIFLFVTIITLLEGSICIAMALPAFMFFSSMGGLLAGVVYKKILNKSNQALYSIAIIPLLVSPVEINFLKLSNTYSVKSTIEINAPAELVWSQLANVKSIQNEELPFSIANLIGIPNPIEANMSNIGVGAVRTSKWNKGIEFKEVITEWVPNKVMAYRFDIDPEKIPDDALDKHVKLGGEYFSPISGSYEIELSEQGRTLLHLETTVQDNTNFGVYSRIWGEVIFDDFHRSLLAMMKERSESYLKRN